ncbi:undecaprenyl-phosphate glucose phosphotransferase [Rhodoblastus sp.]|uniref:undecaprenyl-phosphate glucose phosphotransferase n=2 Tax=Rhodoblastus sp. TaxID=1962975 RepID=UPI003F983196
MGLALDFPAQKKPAEPKNLAGGGFRQAAFGPTPEMARRISQPGIVGVLLVFDLLNFSANGFLSALAVTGPAKADGLFAVCGVFTMTAVGIWVLHWLWSYTIRAPGDFLRQSFNLLFAFAAALALWDAGCVLAGLGQAQLALLRPWTLRWLASGLAAGVIGRALFTQVTGRWTREGRLARRTLIVGGGAPALDAMRRLEKSGKGALQILGVFDDRVQPRPPDDFGRHENPGRYKHLGSFADLEAFCRAEKVDLLVVALPLFAENRLFQVLQQLWVLPVDVRIFAPGEKLPLRGRAYSYIGDVPFLPVFDKPLSDWAVAQKNLFDRTLALVLIVLLSPLLSLLALGVRLSSPGPVLFVQTRYGFNNQPFRAYKFRSLHTASCDPSAKIQVARDDPRVTKFGGFIRRTSLDELPQLFNVLKGDLSLVGPRPHALRAKAAGMIYERAVEGYFARHRVKPGMTGWAQVNGWRGETDTVEKIEQRVAHDFYYIDHWSPWLDIKILAKTPLAVLFPKNAY